MSETHAHPPGWRHRLPLRLLVAAWTGLGLLAAGAIAVRVRIGDQADPWEGGLIVEAWRAAHGLPVYEPVATGHATHMYGPVMTYLLAAVFRVTEPTVAAIRAVNLLSVIALIVILLWLGRPRTREARWLAIAAAGLFLATDGELDNFISRGHVDIFGWLVATCGLLLCARFERSRSLKDLILATALFVVAVFVKQTAAIVALVPVAALLLDRPRWSWRAAIEAVLPPIVVAGALLSTRWLAPLVHFYMLEGPSGYDIEPTRMFRESVAFMAALPLFWILALWSLKRRDLPDAARARLERWAWAALLVCVPTATLFVGKRHGYHNSWLPSLFAALFFCVLQLDLVAERLLTPRLSLPRRLALAAALCVATLLTVPRVYRSLWHTTFPEYAQALQAVRDLPPGLVVSPDDQYMVLVARGTASRSIFFELDVTPADGDYRRMVPAGIRRDLRAARFVVQVDPWKTTTWTHNPATPDSMIAFGFALRERIGPYLIWERADAAPPAAPATTVPAPIPPQ